MNKYSLTEELDTDADGLDRDCVGAIRSILLKAHESKLLYKREDRYAFVRITVGLPEKEFAVWKRSSTSFPATSSVTLRRR